MVCFELETIHTGNNLIARTAARRPNMAAISKNTAVRRLINLSGLLWFRLMYRARFSSGVTSETGSVAAEECRFFVLWSPVNAMAQLGKVLPDVLQRLCYAEKRVYHIKNSINVNKFKTY